MPEFGSLIFGVGVGYLMGRYPWVLALLIALLGLLLVTDPSGFDPSSDWGRVVAAALGGMVGSHFGTRHRKAAGSHV